MPHHRGTYRNVNPAIASEAIHLAAPRKRRSQ